MELKITNRFGEECLVTLEISVNIDITTATLETRPKMETQPTGLFGKLKPSVWKKHNLRGDSHLRDAEFKNWDDSGFIKHMTKIANHEYSDNREKAVAVFNEIAKKVNNKT